MPWPVQAIRSTTRAGAALVSDGDGMGPPRRVRHGAAAGEVRVDLPGEGTEGTPRIPPHPVREPAGAAPRQQPQPLPEPLPATLIQSCGREKTEVLGRRRYAEHAGPALARGLAGGLVEDRAHVLQRTFVLAEDVDRPRTRREPVCGERGSRPHSAVGFCRETPAT